MMRGGGYGGGSGRFFKGVVGVVGGQCRQKALIFNIWVKKWEVIYIFIIQVVERCLKIKKDVFILELCW